MQFALDPGFGVHAIMHDHTCFHVWYGIISTQYNMPNQHGQNRGDGSNSRNIRQDRDFRRLYTNHF